MSNANVLTWLTRKEFQNHRQEWFYGNACPVISEYDRIPPFQLSKAKDGASVSQMLLISFDESSTTNILPNVQSGGIELIETDDFEIISYPDTVALAIPGLQVGLYFLQMSDGSSTWYSEVFQFCESVNDFIKIEYWHREIFCHDEGEFVFNFPYKNRVFIDSDIAKPRYPYEEEVKKNNGFNHPLQQISYKQYQFKAILTESQLDALRLIGLHDDIEINYKGRRYLVNEFLMTDPEWGDRADLAEVVFEFRTNTVVSISGRATTSQPYTSEPGSCLVLNHNCVGTVLEGSIQYPAFQYVNSQGQTVNLQDGDKIVKQTGTIAQPGGTFTVEQYNSSVYTQLSVSAGDVVYSANIDQYYGSGGGNTLFVPSIQLYNRDTGNFAASALTGATHSIYQIIGNEEMLIGNYTYNQIVVEGITFFVSDQATDLIMKIGSSACGVFLTTAEFPIPTGAGIGSMVVGSTFTVT